MPEDYDKTAGWDIGGAHVKLAFVTDGSLKTHQWDCPLWKGLNELSLVLESAIHVLPKAIINHHVTMTGELVDIFSSHDEGVKKIISTFTKIFLNQENIFIFSSKGFLTCEQAINATKSVASVNWIASAEAVADNQKNAVFIDVGSTTTDVLHINDTGLVLNGMTDYERLVTGELIYTGVVRSCVNTLCREIPFQEDCVPLMAELFATSADLYRILDWLPDYADYGVTMDGQAKDKTSSMRRLARMIGKDYSPEEDSDWFKVSEYIAEQQMLMIEKSILPIVQANKNVKKIVGAGVGAFLVKTMAQRLSIDYIDYAECVVPDDLFYERTVSDCAPAVALLFINKIK